MTLLDSLDGWIRTLCYVVPPSAGAVIFLKNWQQNETERVRVRADKDIAIAKETSVGAIAIGNLVRKDGEIERELSVLQKQVDKESDDVKEQFQSIRQEIQRFTMDAIKLISESRK